MQPALITSLKFDCCCSVLLLNWCRCRLMFNRSAAHVVFLPFLLYRILYLPNDNLLSRSGRMGWLSCTMVCREDCCVSLVVVAMRCPFCASSFGCVLLLILCCLSCFIFSSLARFPCTYAYVELIVFLFVDLFCNPKSRRPFNWPNLLVLLIVAALHLRSESGYSCCLSILHLLSIIQKKSECCCCCPVRATNARPPCVGCGIVARTYIEGIVSNFPYPWKEKKINPYLSKHFLTQVSAQCWSTKQPLRIWKRLLQQVRCFLLQREFFNPWQIPGKIKIPGI